MTLRRNVSPTSSLQILGANRLDKRSVKVAKDESAHLINLDVARSSKSYRALCLCEEYLIVSYNRVYVTALCLFARFTQRQAQQPYQAPRGFARSDIRQVCTQLQAKSRAESRS